MLPPPNARGGSSEFAVAGKPGQVQVESRGDFESRIRRCDFPLFYEPRYAVLLQDPDGWGEDVIALARREISAEVRAAWIAHHYIEMRSEHRSCDNSIDRGDAAALLLALTPALSHAMQAAVVLDGQPYPYAKWLPASAAIRSTTRAKDQFLDLDIDRWTALPGVGERPFAPDKFAVPAQERYRRHHDRCPALAR